MVEAAASHPELATLIIPVSMGTVLLFGVYATLHARWSVRGMPKAPLHLAGEGGSLVADDAARGRSSRSSLPPMPGAGEGSAFLDHGDSEQVLLGLQNPQSTTTTTTTQHVAEEAERQDLEFFLSARRSVPLYQIAWAFCSASLGAWVLFSPASFAVDQEYGAGYIGLLSYAFFSGLPIVLIAFLGGSIRDKYPHVLSFGDFALARFGPAVQVYVTAIVLFNMSIALAAEYTAVADLFVTLFGGYGYIPVVVVSAVTMVYTCLGGLSASIVTDQAQGICSVLLLAIVAVYVAATFRPPALPPLPPHLGANENGWASLITVGISFPASALFSDAMWQRVWASVDDRSLKLGASMGAALTMCIVLLFGLGGFLATWASLSTNSNTALFGLFTSAPPIILLLVVVIAVTMNESSVDSFQNALVDSVVSLALSLGARMSTAAARWIVVAINVPIMLVGLQGYRITALYLIANMLTTTSITPLMLGLVPALEGWLHGVDVLMGCGVSLLAVAGYGWLRTGDLGLGIYTYFYLVYDAPAFLIALGASVIGCMGCAWTCQVMGGRRPPPSALG